MNNQIRCGAHPQATDWRSLSWPGRAYGNGTQRGKSLDKPFPTKQLWQVVPERGTMPLPSWVVALADGGACS
jgi:hypothetical protein